MVTAFHTKRPSGLTVHTEAPVDVLVYQPRAPRTQTPDDTARGQPSHPGTRGKPAHGTHTHMTTPVRLRAPEAHVGWAAAVEAEHLTQS